MTLFQHIIIKKQLVCNDLNFRLLFVIVALSSCLAVDAQAPVLAADQLFSEARTAAFEHKNHHEAKTLAKQALSLAPYNADIQTFIGRLYAWDKQYDTALYHFKQVVAYAPSNEEVYKAYSDLEFWNGHYDAALEVCENGLVLHPTSTDLLLKKATILQALKRYTQALQAVDQLLKIDKHHSTALAMAASIKDVLAKNKLAIRYDYSQLDNFPGQPWQLATIAYTRYSKLGTVTGSLLYANRFGRSGWQGELEAYPRINKTFYGYLNIGYSPGDQVFPRYRGGASLFVNLPHGFEAEAGLRYIHFESPTWLYTVYVGKYYRKFLLSTRMYLVPSGTGSSQTYNLMGRYYLNGPDDFIGVNIGSGISPDDRVTNIQYINKNRQSSQQVIINFQHRVSRRNILLVQTGWLRQGYMNETTNNQLDLSIGYQRRF